MCGPVCSPTQRSSALLPTFTVPSDCFCPFRYIHLVSRWILQISVHKEIKRLLITNVLPSLHPVKMKLAACLGPDWCSQVEEFLHTFSLANAGVGPLSFGHNVLSFSAKGTCLTTDLLNRSRSTSNSALIIRGSRESLGNRDAVL